MPFSPAFRISAGPLFTAAYSDEPLRRYWLTPNGEWISRLEDVSGDKPKRQKFKRYPIGVRTFSRTNGVHVLTPYRYSRGADGGGMRRIRKRSGYEQEKYLIRGIKFPAIGFPDDWLYLFVGIDRTSKFAVTQLVDKADRKTAWEFLEHLLKPVPYRIHTILTD